MITIFSIPKSFLDPHIALIQRNAINSWLNLGNNIEIILIGDEEGVQKIASELKINHIPNVERNEYGTPLLSSAFTQVRKESKNSILMYVNADIILTKDFVSTFKKLPKDNFLAFGRRHDVNIGSLINFRDEKWETVLRDKSVLHSASGIDFFIFEKHSFMNLPNFAVGRIGWDNWMIFHAKNTGMKTVDITPVARAYHQNHQYSGVNMSQRKTNPEASFNLSHFSSKADVCTIEDANWTLTAKGMKRNLFCWLPRFKRWLKNFYGI